MQRSSVRLSQQPLLWPFLLVFGSFAAGPDYCLLFFASLASFTAPFEYTNPGRCRLHFSPPFIRWLSWLTAPLLTCLFCRRFVTCLPNRPNHTMQPTASPRTASVSDD